MVDIVYMPGSLPRCADRGATGGQAANRRSFQPDVGPAIESPRASWVKEIYSVSLPLITQQQFEDFVAWFNGDLAYGVNAFVFRHPMTKKDAVWKIADNNPPYQIANVGLDPTGTRRFIRLSFTIESYPAEVPA